MYLSETENIGIFYKKFGMKVSLILRFLPYPKLKNGIFIYTSVSYPRVKNKADLLFWEL